MDRSAYDSRWKNLQSWAGHLWATIEEAIPQAMVELGPPGDETTLDAKNAAEALRAISGSLDNVMNAYDLLLDSVDRPRRYDDFLQGLGDDLELLVETGDETEASNPEVNRTRFARLAAELHYDAGWLLGAIHGALVCGDEEHLDGHLDGLATGIEELMISYDRLQDLLGVMPGRHCAFFDQMVVLEEERPHRRRP